MHGTLRTHIIIFADDSSIKHHNLPFLLSDEIVSFNGSLKTSKPVPYYLKR